MRKTIFTTATIAVMTLTANFSFAQTQDAENCKDHHLFNRLPKFYINSCKENYNEYEFIVGNEKTQTLEGTVTEIIYSYDGEYGPNLPSKLQVVKNYENAIIKMGGTKIYSRTTNDGNWTGATFYLQKDNNEYWLGIYNLINDPVDQYSFILLKKERMKQEITANEMFEKVNSGNALVLYINFETGKSTIKSESQSIVEELYTMLKNNPALNIIIEGHTDNIGNSTSNKTLSEQRAASVKTALVNKGISADRIKTVGYGQDKPIADNSTEDGKAKNRRVEIKKQ
jgi:outer membrane protein OmpA-like peptidoglycan-associated protein